MNDDGADAIFDPGCGDMIHNVNGYYRHLPLLKSPLFDIKAHMAGVDYQSWGLGMDS